MPEGRSGERPSHMLQEHQLRPRKALGQNFLQDERFVERVVGALDLQSDEDVLEIGAGTGVLTGRLARRARSVVAIELDDKLYSLLVTRFKGEPGVRIIHSDALDVDPCTLFETTYKLVGNIPYYVTGPIVRHFLEARCRPGVLVFMVQREVAERMVARPGTLSLLGVSVQYYATVEIVTRVPAGAFFPRPRVDSAIVRLTPFPREYDPAEVDMFFTVARAGFGTRRKQLANALSHGLGIGRVAASELLDQAGIDPTRRAETLELDEWKRLADVFGDIDRRER